MFKTNYFFLSQDDINTLFHDRNKTKDGWEAGPQFTLTDHDRTLIKTLLRLPVSKASEGAICHEHDLCESEFLKQVERMNKDGEAFAFITDEKEFIHKFKTNLRTCRLNANVINAVMKPVSRKKLKVKKHRGRGRGKKKQADTVTENVTERGRVMEMDEAMMENDDDFKENTPVPAAIRKTGGGPTPTLKKVLGQCSMTKGQEKKEDKHVTADMFDEESQEEEPNQIVVHATVHQVLNMVKSTEDKDTSEKNDLQEDIIENTEMKPMDGTCNAFEMTEAKTLNKNETVLKSGTKVAVPGTSENAIENVTEEPMQGKSENDDMLNMTEAKTVKETDTAIESVRENIVPGRSENEGTSKITGDKTVMENIELRTEVNITESMTQANKTGTSATSGISGDKTVMENVELGTVQNVMKSVMENTVPARMENEGTSKVTGDKTVMENIDLITEVNGTESMMQAKKPGTSAAAGVSRDDTVMENVELGTEQKVMKSVTEDTVKGSLLHDPRYKGNEVQKKKQQEQAKPVAFNSKKFYGVDGMLLERDDGSYYPRIVNE